MMENVLEISTSSQLRKSEIRGLSGPQSRHRIACLNHALSPDSALGYFDGEA